MRAEHRVRGKNMRTLRRGTSWWNFYNDAVAHCMDTFYVVLIIIFESLFPNFIALSAMTIKNSDSDSDSD